MKTTFLGNLLIVVLFGACFGVLGQTPLSRPDSEMTGSLRENFLEILVGEKRPGGLVMLKTTCEEIRITAQPKSVVSTFKERLNLLVEANPSYKVVFDAEVVNLLPSDREPEILKIRVLEFLIDTSRPLPDLVRELLESKEIKPKADEIGLNKGLQRGGLLAPPREGVFVHLTNVTLLDALNSIARAYGRAVWEYTESSCQGEKRHSLGFTVNLH